MEPWLEKFARANFLRSADTAHDLKTPLNIAVLNLLPIPILDGGHIFIMAIEGLFRRDFSIRLKEKMLMAGFVVLLTLMVTVIYNDLTRISWIERLMPWR